METEDRSHELDMLENNSYWDIDILNEYNKPTWNKIMAWERCKPKTLIGKLWKRFNILRLKKKLYRYE
jgi:hypothetical protein